MTKYIIAVLAVVAGFLGLFAWGQQGYQKALQATNEGKVIATQRDAALESLRAYKSAQARNTQLSAARQDVAKQQRATNQKRTEDLHDALKSSPDWAAQPVPDSVWDSLGPSPAAPGKATAAR